MPRYKFLKSKENRLYMFSIRRVNNKRLNKSWEHVFCYLIRYKRAKSKNIR